MVCFFSITWWFMIFGSLAFPIKLKENIQPVVVDSEDTSGSTHGNQWIMWSFNIAEVSEAENKVEFGAECLQSGSIEGKLHPAIVVLPYILWRSLHI